MKNNMGSIDQVARITLGVGLISIGVVFQDCWGLIGIIPLSTALVGWCPLYWLLGLRTCRHCLDGS